jgi:ethanolamine utilization protein EutQ
MGKCIIAVDDILEAAKSGKKRLPAAVGECIVTPGARDKAAELGILLDEGPGAPAAAAPASAQAQPSPVDQVVRQVCALMKERLGSGVAAAELERLVREVVAVRLAGTGAAAPAEAGRAVACVDGVCFISGARLLEGGSGPVPVEGKVLVADAIRCGEKYKLAGGFMDWQKASFSRTVEFPEIGIVLEGELQLTVGGRTLTTKPGDMVYFPKGAQVVYSAPARVRIACVNCID